jgi:hypothetical protein
MEDESQSIELLLNSFLQYYKKTFPDENISYFFDKVENYNDTNKIMEHFYQCLNDYNSSRNKTCVDYDETRLDELDEIYILQIDKKNIKMSDNVISLLIEIINNYSDKNWNIIE